jgi:ribosomal protein L35
MKQKSKQAARKRFTITAGGKLRRRATHQAHFNARETGQEVRRKHAYRGVDASDMARVAEVLPYFKHGE